MTLLLPAQARLATASANLIGRCAVALQGEAVFFRNAAVVALLGQVALWGAGIVSRVMLFGDGAFFVYALATGHAWELKWQFLTTRLSAYVFTVLPAEGLCRAFSCDGSAFAAVNSATFYAVPVVQFAVLVAMAWRRFPALLAFPIAQYGFALGLGYGFPSEILLAPGFFWMAMFSLLLRPWPAAVFVISFAGLVFSHELALAAALVVAGFFAMQWKNGAHQKTARLVLPFAMGLILCADLFLILNGGGEGGNSNAAHVFELKRILKNPMLWLVAASVIVSAVIALFVRHRPSRAAVTAILLTWVLATAASGQVLSFAQGRYDSARTVIGVAMVVLGILFVLLQRYTAASRADPAKLSTFLRLGLSGGLAVTFTANALFLADWDRGLTAFETAVNAPQMPGPAYRTPQQSRLSPDEAAAIERSGFSWTWPYRSIVLARNYRPQTVFYLPDSIGRACGSPRLKAFFDSPVPAAVTQGIEAFACRKLGQGGT